MPKLHGSLQPASLDVRNSDGPLVSGADLTCGPVAQPIPISLLELNTFGHAVCALFIYLLWWEKPFEVDIPIIVHSEALLDMYALAWVNTKDTRGGSPLVRSMKSAYRDLLQADEQFHKLSKVRLLFSP